MPFVVVCASCEYELGGPAEEGNVICELVHQRVFATREEADVYARDIWITPSIWGHPRRSPQDVISVVEMASADASGLDRALRCVRENDRLREQLKHVYEVWIDGRNPYAVTLAEARAYPGPDAVAMLEGDSGGQTYVVCPVAYIRCDEATLRRLLLDIDVKQWNQPDDVQLSYFRAHVGENVGGGMGGGLVTDGVGVHARLRELGLESGICAVLAGERPTLG
jgi:hypothetical protein